MKMALDVAKAAGSVLLDENGQVNENALGNACMCVCVCACMYVCVCVCVVCLFLAR